MQDWDNPRRDSYLASLSRGQRESLRSLLLDSSVSRADLLQRVPPFGKAHAKQAGKRPSEQLIYELAAGLRLQVQTSLQLVKLQETAKALDQIEAAVKPFTTDRAREIMMGALTKEVLDDTLAGDKPKVRNATAQVLVSNRANELKADAQRLAWDKFRETIKTKVESGLDEIAALFQRAPELQAEFEALRTKLNAKLAE